MALQKELFLVSVGPFQKEKFQVNLSGYFSSEELSEFFKIINSKDHVLAKFLSTESKEAMELV